MRDIVIPGRAKHEPGISRNNFWIPGLRLGSAIADRRRIPE
jgi:hypothetical protein